MIAVTALNALKGLILNNIDPGYSVYDIAQTVHASKDRVLFCFDDGSVLIDDRKAREYRAFSIYENMRGQGVTFKI